MKLFDSHAHYNDEKFEEDREQILREIRQENVERVVVAGYNLESSIKAVEIANTHQNIYATVGISPNDLDDNLDLKQIEKLAKDRKVVAIGEIGLDYYWNKENKEEQKKVFKQQIELANKLELPIVIHTREAVIDTIDIIKNEIKSKKTGIFHCCPMNVELIKEAIKLGYYISFSGNITFKNAKNADKCIETVPNNKLLIETDSPYMSPEPYRGRRNDSRKVVYVAEKIAQVKHVSLEEIAEITYTNANKIFEIKYWNICKYMLE